MLNISPPNGELKEKTEKISTSEIAPTTAGQKVSNGAARRESTRIDPSESQSDEPEGGWLACEGLQWWRSMLVGAPSRDFLERQCTRAPTPAEMDLTEIAIQGTERGAVL